MVRYIPYFDFLPAHLLGFLSIICVKNSNEYLHSPLTTYVRIYVDNSFQLMIKPFLKS